MEESVSILSSLYLPVVGGSLVLPNVSVAEIVDYQTPEAIPDSPEWFLGNIKWRGVTLPVISYERLNDTPLPDNLNNTRIAVINTIGKDHQALPFFALVTQGIPRQTKIDQESIKEVEEGDALGAADLMKVVIMGDEAIIPNVEYIESMIMQSRPA
ncbi:chemotaxis protein CheW [Alkalimarinus sediminis]|uniref:Chemotaxis protein CheW n=1 Tax=Alkalimarinus sediminis TaxID=1632866 RepID=A0A9E8HH63_9ALTE|nr:chemotaxis protein CheW [Alkalimarinus sediminis]UZW74593.1 chemotaxis protein CheW [Alkalimarinus sediminis]